MAKKKAKKTTAKKPAAQAEAPKDPEQEPAAEPAFPEPVAGYSRQVQGRRSKTEKHPEFSGNNQLLSG